MATLGPRPLVLACGALARDLRVVLAANGLETAIDVEYLPASLHNRPERIVPELRPRLAEARRQGRPVLVAYADCGTGGLLDALLAEHPGVTRLPGAHCYELFAGGEAFAALHDAEPGTFYVTDFLARHFDALVWSGLGLDRHPELRDAYFGHYRRLVHLAQGDDERSSASARAAAERLGLAFERHWTGRHRLGDSVALLPRRAA
jgi:hypothetical protein